jgi:S-adenosylmethionine hydrolase
VEVGARVLVRALPFMPAGVHLAVVDPDVVAARRALALRLGEQTGSW